MKGDPIYLTKVMEIIVNNAIKFTIDKGTVIIKATYDSSSQIFRFAVKDSGIGMSDEQVKIIFQPFTQVDGSFTRKYGGLGLGLTIVNNLVKLMSGTIHVDSQKNVGSIFIIEVPFQIANKENNNEY